MAYQNINQYYYKKYGLKFVYDGMDMSLASDEKDYNEEENNYLTKICL